MILAMLALALLPVQATAQEHWTCDAHNYRYDMTLYVALMRGDNAETDYSDYEIAAFVGDECRGVMEPMTLTHGGTTYHLGYLRVRSNNTSGETVSLKLYDRSKDTEVPLAYTVDFMADTMVGMPSSPEPLYRHILGDCNGDGDVTVVDVMLAVDYILDDGRTSLVFMNSDINLDENITVVDVMAIVDIILLGR